MRFKTAILSLLILICPCAFCYGQLSFSGVNGERGYSAMRGVFKWDLDNGFVLAPSYEYYRMSDEKGVEETGTTHRYGLRGSYEWTDSWKVLAGVAWQPRAVGYNSVRYYAGLSWMPFYRWACLKDPQLSVRVGQGRSKTYVNTSGERLKHIFKETETKLQTEATVDVGSWNIKGSWQKVLQYSSPPQPNISFSWADIPFMTAVVQGFLREAAALRVSYKTQFITPYASLVRYQYAKASSPAAAVNAGLHIHWGETTLSGGVEVFEPRREMNRKTFFSMSVEIEFD